MGLIKAAASAISSTFHDQWKDFINCEDLGNDTLMVKKTTENGVISKINSLTIYGICQICNKEMEDKNGIKRK